MILLRNDLKKILLILSMTSIIIALLIVVSIPSYTNYELNLYTVYPWYFWTLLSIPYLLSYIVIYLDENVNKYTYLILLSAQFALIILLLIPVFRGYSIYGATDTLTHLGMVEDLYTGHIGFLNPYPIIHLFIFEMSQITNVNPDAISLYIPIIFTNLYIFSMFILSRILNLSKKESLFVYLFSTIPVFGAFLMVEDILPSTDFFLFIPLILYILLKSRFYNNKLSYSIILVLLLILIAFAHPETTVFFVLIIVVLIFVTKYLNYIRKYNIKEDFFSPLLILIIAMFAWFSSTFIFSYTVQSFYSVFVENLGPGAPLSQLGAGIKISLIDALNVIVHEYGSAIIYLAIGGTISLFIIKNYIFKKEITFRNLFLSCLFFVFIIVSFIFLLKGTPIGYNVYREIKYPLLVSTIFMAIFFARLSKKDALSKIKIYLPFATILMIIIVFISIGGLYPSPSVQNTNHQDTYSDINGMSFVLNNGNNSINILELTPNVEYSRYADYLLGYDTASQNGTLIYSESILPPPHFGYDANSSIGDSYKKPQYLLIYPPYDYYYQAIYPKYTNLWRYSPQDFEKLENNDTNSELIYNNGEFKIAFIEPENVS